MTISGAGSGNLILGQNSGNGNVLIQPNAGGQASLIIKNQGSGDLLTASAGATTKFIVDNSGDISFAGGQSSAFTKLTSSSTVAQIINFPAVTNGNNTLCYQNDSTCGFSVGTNYWRLAPAGGAITPTISTLDLLIGGTATSTAKFAFTNVNTGTPTASISAQTAGGPALSIDAAGNIQTYDRSSLTLGGSATGNINFFNGSNKLDSSGNLTLAGNIVAGTYNTDTLNSTALTFSGASPVISPSTANSSLQLNSNGSGNLLLGQNSGNGNVLIQPNAGGQAALMVIDNGTGDLFTASAGATPKFAISNSGNISLSGLNTQGGIIYSTNSNGALGVTAAAGSIGQCLTAGNPANGAPTWGNCTFGDSTNWWSVSNGALFPINSTTDLLIGGQATTSAKFAVLNLSTGTPVASISGGLNGAGAYLSSNGTLATTSKQSLTLGDSNTGNINLFNGSSYITSGGNLTLAGVIQAGGGAPLAYNRTGTLTSNNGLSTSADLFVSGKFEVNGNLFVDGGLIETGTVGTVGWLQRNGGALEPTNITDDLLLGSTSTSSAKFAFYNVTGAGTPTASISAQTAGGPAFSVDSSGNVQTYDFNTLTLGGTKTGDINFSLVAGKNIRVGSNIGQTTTGVSCFDVTSGLVTNTNGSCPGTSQFWQENLGAVAPKNITDDLLLGGTATKSAKFAFINNIGAGTPTASISAGAAATGATYLQGNGLIATTNKQTLQIGNSTTGTIIIGGQGLNSNTVPSATISGLLHLDDQWGVEGAGLAECESQNKRLTYNGITKQFACVVNAATVKSYIDTTQNTVISATGTNYWDGNTPIATLSSSLDSVLIQGTIVGQNTSVNKPVSVSIWMNTAGALPTCAGTGANSKVGGNLGGTGNNSPFVYGFSLVAAPGTTTASFAICSEVGSGGGGTVDRIDIQLQEVSTSDLAEIYPTLQSNIQHGDVVTSDPTLKSGVMKTTTANDSAAMGVISTKPAQIIGGNDIPGGSNATLVALSGRVPVKVTSLNGNVNVGDPITSSNLPGIGMKQLQPGKIVGRVIESVNNWDSYNCTVVNSLEDANTSWPQDTTGANNDHTCFAIPTKNVPGVPTTYTKSYVYVGKVMMKVENVYNTPDIFTGNSKEQAKVTTGNQIGFSDLENANKYFLVDESNNILTNNSSFSSVTSANGTFGNLQVDSVNSAFLNASSINLGGFTISGTPSGVLAFKNTSNQQIFGLDNTGNATLSGQLTTGGESLAQDYKTTDTSLEVGDVLSIDQVLTGNVSKSKNSYDKTILGIYSDKSGLKLSQASKSEKVVPIAIAGRALVKVNDENGPIHKGDYITSSSTPGVAMKATNAGEVLGKALEDFNCVTSTETSSPLATGCTGKIMTSINVSFVDPNNILSQISLDGNGRVIISTISATSIRLDSNFVINGNAINGSLNDALAATAQSITNSSTNIGLLQVSLLGLNQKVDSLGTRISNLEATVASSEATLAETTLSAAAANDLAKQALAGTSSLSATVASIAANTSDSLNSLSKRFADLLLNITSSTSATPVVTPTAFMFTNPFTASTSVQLNLDQDFALNNGTISGNLTVAGRTTVRDLGITGDVLAGVLTIRGLNDDGTASINTLSGDLKLQDEGIGGLNILSGKVTIDTSGNVNVLESVTAKIVNTQKLNIVTTDNAASPSAVLSASAGVATINAGSDNVTIPTSAVTNKSLIYITFSGDYNPATRYWIDSKIAKKSFTVRLDLPVASSAKFNWWIVN